MCWATPKRRRGRCPPASRPRSRRTSAARRSSARTTCARRSRRSTVARAGGRMIEVELRGLEVFGHHGVSETEQERGQTLLWDVAWRLGEVSRRRPVGDCGLRRGGRMRQGCLGWPALPVAGVAGARPPRMRSTSASRCSGCACGCGRHELDLPGRVHRGDRRAAVTRAYVGLGANLGDREATMRRAIELLGDEVVAVSTFRETDPVGYEDQPRFLNAAVALETDARPARAARPAAGGRARARADARRPALRAAHDRPRPARSTATRSSTSRGCASRIPRLAERRFALEPLFELDPGLIVPGVGPVSALLAGLE